MLCNVVQLVRIQFEFFLDMNIKITVQSTHRIIERHLVVTVHCTAQLMLLKHPFEAISPQKISAEFALDTEDVVTNEHIWIFRSNES